MKAWRRRKHKTYDRLPRDERRYLHSSLQARQTSLQTSDAVFSQQRTPAAWWAAPPLYGWGRRHHGGRRGGNLAQVLRLIPVHLIFAVKITPGPDTFFGMTPLLGSCPSSVVPKEGSPPRGTRGSGLSSARKGGNWSYNLVSAQCYLGLYITSLDIHSSGCHKRSSVHVTLMRCGTQPRCWSKKAFGP